VTSSSGNVVVVVVDEVVVDVVDDVEVVVEVEVEVKVDDDVVGASDEVVAVGAPVSIAFVDDVADPAEHAAARSCDAASSARPNRRCTVGRVINWA
jgi:hypothetical protein